MNEVKEVFATGVTITFGNTYNRIRFTKEEIGIDGEKESEDVVADVSMSPQLLDAIIDIATQNRNIKQSEATEGK